MTDSKAILWNNLVHVMTARWGAPNINRLSRESGVGLGTVARLKTSAMSLAMDKLDKISDCLGLQPWQLLHPGYSTGDDKAMGLSPMAVSIGSALDAITDPAAHQKAYALAVQVVELASAPAPSEQEPDHATMLRHALLR